MELQMWLLGKSSEAHFFSKRCHEAPLEAHTYSLPLNTVTLLRAFSLYLEDLSSNYFALSNSGMRNIFLRVISFLVPLIKLMLYQKDGIKCI